MQLKLFKRWKIKILHFFLPKVCVICKKEGEDLCFECIDKLTPSSPSFIDGTEVFSCFIYDENIAKILHEVKYNEKAEITNVMARFIISSYLKEFNNGILIPIPISFLKRVRRGYNIPHLISFFIKKKLGLKIETILKKRNALSQVGLTKKERTINAKSFFSLQRNSNLQGKTLILIDDIITTGATIKSAINELKKLEPEQIKVFTFAKREI
jgi:competence protein ComFC